MGYMGPHEQPAFLEEHMMPSMLEVYDAQRTRAQASLSNPSRHPIPLSPYASVSLGEMKVRVPSNPPPTEFELFETHAEMLADAERAADDGAADHADDGDADEEDNADRPIELPTKQDKGKGRAVG
ncbi:hypothetical protein HYPSUDRAFT_209250 [Hypholoma sublateritium FD-334 SS-4]|uniref:Uncharacterized protein n=1 Tax=Hypholoma sublateritium (strain FD-334 SS-4) TaxID=945553 RepID=A0A0D2NZB8_HYPSF|nr:hypothetical protein HYPSUDRAFT_209250 [Hypholoma sublateritium FD-334 SS-4]